MKRLAKGLVAIVVLVLVGTVGVLYWGHQPIRIDTTTPDPAVEYANGVLLSEPVFKENYFGHSGHLLHYVEAGEGEPIIFMHGFPSFWYSFIRQATELRQSHRVILVDGLGAGRSAAPTTPRAYTLESMADGILALMDELGLPAAHFVGHDWGAGLAYAITQQHPDRVLTVTGISAPPPTVLLELLLAGGRQSEASAYIETLKSANPFLLWTFDAPGRIWTGAYEPLVAAGHLSEEEGQLFRSATSNPKRINAHVNWYRANIPSPDKLSETDFWPGRSTRISIPNLFIWGTNDPTLTNDTVVALAAVSDEFMPAPIQDVGHWPHVEKSDYVTQLISVHLLNRHKAKSGPIN